MIVSIITFCALIFCPHFLILNVLESRIYHDFSILILILHLSQKSYSLWKWPEAIEGKLLLLLLLSKLLISRSVHLWKIFCVSFLCSCGKQSLPSSAISFSSQNLLFLWSLRSCILLLLPTSFTSVIRPSIVSWKREFFLRICPIQLAFLAGYCVEVSYVLVYVQELLQLVTFSYHFIFPILLLHLTS